LAPTYGAPQVAFVRGRGAWLWDADGRKYLDFLAGIAVCSTGHCHPRVVTAIQQQASTLIHTSNLYCIPPQVELAKRLVELSFADRCFFANSGAEANEAAIKMARRWAGRHKASSARTIVTAEYSFHGRTLATVTATGQAKYREPFAPLPGGFRYVPYDDIDALREAVDEEVCAVMIEPLQGEGGVVVPHDSYLPAVRELCDERGVLLILDEVQTGMGRTGEWFAYQHSGIEPDIMTLAKALASGIPIGACLAREEVATAFQPGDHASTFGGNFVSCAAALTTIDVIESEDLVSNAARMGALIEARISGMAAEEPLIVGCRGRGLLKAVVLSQPKARELEAACMERGLLVNAMHDPTLVRLAPPLIVSEDEVEQALTILLDAARAVAQ